MGRNTLRMSMYVAQKLNPVDELEAWLHQNMLKTVGITKYQRAANLASWGISRRGSKRTYKLFKQGRDNGYDIFVEKYTKRNCIDELISRIRN